MSEQITPVIAMCRGGKLILLCGGRQTVIDVGSMIYAGELAEAINGVSFSADEDVPLKAISEVGCSAASPPSAEGARLVENLARESDPQNIAQMVVEALQELTVQAECAQARVRDLERAVDLLLSSTAQADLAEAAAIRANADRPAVSPDRLTNGVGRNYVPKDRLERIVRESADEIAGGQPVRDVLRGAIVLALSAPFPAARASQTSGARDDA